MHPPMTRLLRALHRLSGRSESPAAPPASPEPPPAPDEVRDLMLELGQMGEFAVFGPEIWAGRGYGWRSVLEIKTDAETCKVRGEHEHLVQALRLLRERAGRHRGR